MIKAKILVYRANETSPTQIEKIHARIREQNTLVFGRPYVPSVVKHAVRSHALDLGISLRTALEALIVEHQTFDLLEKSLKKISIKTQRKHQRQREAASRKSTPPRGSEFKTIRLVQGGAPGLGGSKNKIKTR